MSLLRQRGVDTWMSLPNALRTSEALGGQELVCRCHHTGGDESCEHVMAFVLLPKPFTLMLRLAVFYVPFVPFRVRVCFQNPKAVQELAGCGPWVASSAPATTSRAYMGTKVAIQTSTTYPIAPKCEVKWCSSRLQCKGGEMRPVPVTT